MAVVLAQAKKKQKACTTDCEREKKQLKQECQEKIQDLNDEIDEVRQKAAHHRTTEERKQNKEETKQSVEKKLFKHMFPHARKKEKFTAMTQMGYGLSMDATALNSWMKSAPDPMCDSYNLKNASNLVFPSLTMIV